MDERFDYLTKNVIPLVIAKLDFNNPDLEVDISETAFFIHSQSTNKHFTEAYDLVFKELKNESKKKINVLTAEKKVISDNYIFLRSHVTDGNSQSAKNHFKVLLDQVDSELNKEIEEYHLIESVETYVSSLKHFNY